MKTLQMYAEPTTYTESMLDSVVAAAPPCPMPAKAECVNVGADLEPLYEEGAASEFLVETLCGGCGRWKNAEWGVCISTGKTRVVPL